MSQNDTKNPVNRDNDEPRLGNVSVPIWLIMAFGLLFYWSLVYVSDHAGGFDKQVYAPFGSVNEVADANPKSAGDAAYQMGQTVFNATCTACHQPNGMGKDGIAPPLVGSEWVLAPGPERIAHIALYGLTGPISVKGKDYSNLTMVPWKDTFDDEHIAAVLTYIRNTWGNKAAPVKPEQVTAARKENHRGPETSAELLQIPAQ
jgi:mono/diheme cytochrome c family protein